MTVLGPVDSGELGVTLPHEHVFLDLTREYRGYVLLNDPAVRVARGLRFFFFFLAGVAVFFAVAVGVVVGASSSPALSGSLERPIACVERPLAASVTPATSTTPATAARPQSRIGFMRPP